VTKHSTPMVKDSRLAQRASGSPQERASRSTASRTQTTSSRAASRSNSASATSSRSTSSRSSSSRSSSTRSSSTRTPPRGTTRRAESRAPRHATRPRVNARRPDERARDQKSGNPRRRLIVALGVLAFVFALIVGRVVMLQTSDAESYRSAGTAQWTRTTNVAPQRGTIFDRDGNELAMSVPAVAISINTQLIQDGPATIQMLDDLLDLPDDKVAALLADVVEAKRGFVYVARQVDVAVGDQIAALNRPGINVDPEAQRELPGGLTGQTVLGHTNIDGEGIAGLELQYDELLSGAGGRMTREIAPGGRTIPGSETILESPIPGDDLVLTIDRSVQFATEKILVEQTTALDARGGLIIVMDTDTGEIYAMSSVRRDDETGEHVVTSGNYAAVDSYEPGSVAKVITVAGALNEGAVTPSTTFDVPWKATFGEQELTDSHVHETEPMTVSDILVESSNIGTILVQQQMGRQTHHNYMTSFGLGSKTALDFPGESPGLLKPVDQLWGSERVTVAYGQGLSSTPIQMAAAINVIANGGVYVAPKLVRATVGPDGTMTDIAPSATHRVVSEVAADQTTTMMQEVVCSGTATDARVEGLPIAGKTGTAYKTSDNGTYFNENGDRIYYASFAGFFPADDPQVTVLVAIDEPPASSDDRFGGRAAAPIFAALAPALTHELGIQPGENTVGCAN
jgi:cell division protein FtsI (penicillin-binding protein 3)